MAQLVSVLLVCQMAACVCAAVSSVLAERGWGRVVAVGLVVWSGVGLAGSVAGLGW